MRLLLDTCTIIWAVAEPEKLSRAARKELSDSASEILVSPISCAELACAVEHGRVQLDRHWRQWFRYFVEFNGWKVQAIDLAIMEEAFALAQPIHTDPADRILLATARLLNASIVTPDDKIRKYPHVDSLW